MRSLILGSLVVGVVAIGVLLSLLGPGPPRSRNAGARSPPSVRPVSGHRDPASPAAPAAGWESAPSATPLSLFARSSTLPGVSSLWTPEGEHPVGDDRRRGGSPPPPAPAPASGPDFEEAEAAAVAAQLDELRLQLAATPAEVVVANHAYGLFELAAIHLSQQPPRLDEARLAVDAMGALVEGLPGRLGDAEESLVSALAQIRLAYVQITGAARTGDGASTSDTPGGSGTTQPGTTAD